MTTQTKSENNEAEQKLSDSVLEQLSEPEPVKVLDGIESLQTDLQRVPRSDAKVVEEVRSTQGILKRWRHFVEGIFSRKQINDDKEQIGNWDNEGGSTP
jgi:hypothetical protein